MELNVEEFIGADGAYMGHNACNDDRDEVDTEGAPGAVLRRLYTHAKHMVRWRSCGVWSSTSARKRSGSPPVNSCAC